ncbi:unnamed protein product [Orchesella dallaii]|uniref:Uncharacterized protein n=1 Tax=Orchesella dallaii TaxID=48710 RepID=A0ABP1S118_9HEXA
MATNMLFIFLIPLLTTSGLQIKEKKKDIHPQFVPAQEKLKWISKNSVIPSQLIPAGRENIAGLNTILYVAKAMHQDQWVPGEAGFDEKNGIFYFHLVHNGTEFSMEHFVLLLQPAGTTSWQKMNGSITHAHPVFGGADPDTGEANFICRSAVDTGNNGTMLLVGRAVPSSGKCHLFHGKEYILSSFELLVVNAYGLARNA